MKIASSWFSQLLVLAVGYSLLFVILSASGPGPSGPCRAGSGSSCDGGLVATPSPILYVAVYAIGLASALGAATYRHRRHR